MICYFCTANNRMPIDRYLAAEVGTPLWARTLALTYEEAPSMASYPDGLYVFSDIELLSGDLRLAAGALHARLSASGARRRILNHPLQSMRRSELLSARARNGTNAFRAYSPSQLADVHVRFPVFLRFADDHMGSRTGLLADPAALERALEEHAPTPLLREAILITEFEDCSDAEGIYRKYSAFCVDGVIIPRHVLFSRDWMQKNPDLLDSRFLEEEGRYLVSNPHAEALRAMFAEARIEFGRIDYGISKDGTIQVWEINTNPSILRIGYQWSGARAPVHREFARQLRERLTELDPGEGFSTEWAWAKTVNAMHQLRRFHKDIVWPRTRIPLRALSRMKKRLLRQTPIEAGPQPVERMRARSAETPHLDPNR